MVLNCGIGEDSLRVPWTARRSNQSIIKEISPQCSLERLMLKLKLQYFVDTWCEELTHLKRPWWWERLRAGGEGDHRGWDGWHQQLNGHGFGWTLGVGVRQGGLVFCGSWGCRVGHDRNELTEWEFAAWLRESKLGFCNNLEGLKAEGSRRE